MCNLFKKILHILAAMWAKIFIRKPTLSGLKPKIGHLDNRTPSIKICRNAYMHH